MNMIIFSFLFFFLHETLRFAGGPTLQALPAVDGAQRGPATAVVGRSPAAFHHDTLHEPRRSD